MLAVAAHGMFPAHSSPALHLDNLTCFGLVAVSSMLVTYALEKRNPLFILAFSASCVMGSAYGFLQGAWPFGMVEAIWSVVAFRRWWKVRPRHRMFRRSNRLKERRLTAPESDEPDAQLN